MNIFFTHKDPEICAKYLDDKRVVKMILESAQMLCTAANELSGYHLAPYKSTHKNHPSNVWARTSLENFMWLHKHATALSTEYTHRYGKVHKSLGVLTELLELLPQFQHKFPERGLTQFVNCARNKSLGLDYTNEADIHHAYRMYLNDRWETDKRIPTFYGRIA
jgi:hypothetical protein